MRQPPLITAKGLSNCVCALTADSRHCGRHTRCFCIAQPRLVVQNLSLSAMSGTRSPSLSCLDRLYCCISTLSPSVHTHVQRPIFDHLRHVVGSWHDRRILPVAHPFLSWNAQPSTFGIIGIIVYTMHTISTCVCFVAVFPTHTWPSVQDFAVCNFMPQPWQHGSTWSPHDCCESLMSMFAFSRKITYP